ncbi:MAG: ABC transporter substrate-binding protein [Herpetosiphonaceae bacterium]|nr:MAG: ABC transporter substrate-binding protein [Herpetosiphonaceae bacterium]
MYQQIVRTLSAFIGLALLLSACGGAAPSSSSDSSTSGTPAPTAPAAASQGKTVIKFWHVFGGARGDHIQRVIDDFNYLNPDIHVEAQIFGSYEDLLTAVKTSAEKRSLPHLFQMYEAGSQLALDLGITAPAAELAQQVGLDLRQDDLIPSVRNYYTFNGKMNSFAWNSSTPIMYVNMDILQAAGVQEIPQTWGELMAACETIVTGKHAEKCITFPIYSWFFEQWLSEQNALLANNDNGRSARATEVLLDSEPSLRIARFIKELNDKGYLLYSGKIADWDGANAALVSKQVAFEISSTSEVAGLTNEAHKAGFTMRTAMLPIPDGIERNGVIVGGASVWVVGGLSPQETAAALKFAQYLGETEQMVTWHKITGYFPVRQSAVRVLEEQGWFTSHPNYAVAFEQLISTKANYASAGAVLGPFPEVRKQVEVALEKIITAGVDPEVAMKEADAAADQALKAYNESIK